jgi:hypothetical protein
MSRDVEEVIGRTFFVYQPHVTTPANFARAMIAALKAHGYAVVPREPTQGMMNAYRHAFVSEKRFDMREVWSSMLTASEEK